MVTVEQAQLPMENLPIQLAPPWRFVNYHTLVPHLLDLYPDISFEDVQDIVEEKTRHRIHGEDFACYNRCVCLRREFEESSQ